MLANRSVSFDPCIDDDMSSLCSSFVTANVGPSIRRGKYSQYNPYYNPPSIQEDLVSEKDLDCFFEGIHCKDNNPNKSKFNNTKKTKCKSKSYSGEIYARCNRSSLLFRRWSGYTWYFAKPSTLILFGSRNDLKMYQDPYLLPYQKEKLVKYAIDFDTSGKLTEKAREKHKSFKPPPIPSNFMSNKPATYVVTEIKAKVYKSKNPCLYNFKIIRWSNFDRKTMAAFGSYDLNSLKGFHKSLAKCVKRANKASRPRSEKHVSGDGDSSVADESVASYSTGISLWSYSTIGSKRSGKSRVRNKLNKAKLNEQYRQ